MDPSILQALFRGHGLARGIREPVAVPLAEGTTSIIMILVVLAVDMMSHPDSLAIFIGNMTGAFKPTVCVRLLILASG
jgi:hypothetical protein